MNLYPTVIDIPNVELANGHDRAIPDAIVIPRTNGKAFKPRSGAIAITIGTTIKIAVELEINILVIWVNKTRIQNNINGLIDSPIIAWNPLAISFIPPAASSAFAIPKHPAKRPTIFQLTENTAFF